LLSEIREIIHERLLVTPLEQKQKIEYIKELILKEKTNNELIKKLKEEVNLATLNKDKEVRFCRLQSLEVKIGLPALWLEDPIAKRCDQTVGHGIEACGALRRRYGQANQSRSRATGSK
jgi:hypothetical protein